MPSKHSDFMQKNRQGDECSIAKLVMHAEKLVAAESASPAKKGNRLTPEAGPRVVEAKSGSRRLEASLPRTPHKKCTLPTTLQSNRTTVRMKGGDPCHQTCHSQPAQSYLSVVMTKVYGGARCGDPPLTKTWPHPVRHRSESTMAVKALGRGPSPSKALAPRSCKWALRRLATVQRRSLDA